MKKNILDGIHSFEYDKNREHIFGVKSAIIWGYSNQTNGVFPMLYISKPKHVSQEDYELLLNKLEITINR